MSPFAIASPFVDAATSLIMAATIPMTASIIRCGEPTTLRGTPALPALLHSERQARSAYILDVPPA